MVPLTTGVGNSVGLGLNSVGVGEKEREGIDVSGFKEGSIFAPNKPTTKAKIVTNIMNAGDVIILFVFLLLIILKKMSSKTNPNDKNPKI